MHIDQPFRYQIRAQNGIPQNWLSEIRHPIRLLRDRIYWNYPEVTSVYKILQRVRRLPSVKGVIVNRVSYCAQICFQDRCVTMLNQRWVVPSLSKEHQHKQTKCAERQAGSQLYPRLHPHTLLRLA